MFKSFKGVHLIATSSATRRSYLNTPPRACFLIPSRSELRAFNCERLCVVVMVFRRRDGRPPVRLYLLAYGDSAEEQR